MAVNEERPAGSAAAALRGARLRGPLVFTGPIMTFSSEVSESYAGPDESLELNDCCLHSDRLLSGTSPGLRLRYDLQAAPLFSTLNWKKKLTQRVRSFYRAEHLGQMV